MGWEIKCAINWITVVTAWKTLKAVIYKSDLAKPYNRKSLHVSCVDFCLHKGSKNAPIISYASMSQNGIDVHLFMKKITYCNQVTKPEA